MENIINITTREQEFNFCLKILDSDTIYTDIAKITQDVAIFLEDNKVDIAESYPVQVAIEELLTNTAKFGQLPRTIEQDQLKTYPEVQKVEGKIEIHDDYLRLTISDNAPAFDPKQQQNNSDVDEPFLDRPIGGLGLYLVFKMFNRFDYLRIAGHNICTCLLQRNAQEDMSKLLEFDLSN